jgi:ATP-binding cassette, subfamily F, member 3
LPETVRTRLGSFGFGQEKAFVPVADLSGGERARLNLALVTHAAPSLLILDEPTNHLDIESREVLVEAINEFPGAVVLASHDEHLIELIADRLWLVADGTVRPFEGDIEDYRRLILERGGAEGGGCSNGSDTRRAARRLAAERRRELEPLRQRARRAEQEVARLTKERDAVDRALANGKGNGLSPGEALKRRAELVRQIERAETDWLAAAEAIEQEARA